MPESLLIILKFLLLALLYLFFLRVLRAVWSEVYLARPANGSVPAGQRQGVRDRVPTQQRNAGRLKILEPATARGQVFPLGEELTLGRAASCQVRVEDSYASQLHARIFERDGQHFVEDLGSTNKTYVNRRGTHNRELVTGPMALRIGDRLIVGKTVFEVAK